jgi:RND family efflux transporter MFP subunit
VAGILVPTTLLLLIAGLGVAVVGLGVIPRLRARADLEQRTTDRIAERPRVTVVRAAASSGRQQITLPARLQALLAAAIYPREGGYVKEIKVDIGDTVEAGQVLAVIDTPVLDQQILLSGANVYSMEAKEVQAEAQAKVSETTYKRLMSLNDPRAVSQQSIDDAKGKNDVDAAALVAARAALKAQKADLERLRQQKELATIVAPFAGEISERGYDVGDLVIADKTDTSRPIYRLADRGQIRVFIDLPQTVAAAVAPGQDFGLDVRELPGRKMTGKIVRVSAAMDTATRTRLAEGRVENSERLLLPGMFAEVTLTVYGAGAKAIVPGEAMLVRDGKTQLAIVGEDGRLAYRDVTIGRDSGATVEILAGVAPGERVVVNLARQVPAGASVEAVEREEQK